MSDGVSSLPHFVDPRPFDADEAEQQDHALDHRIVAPQRAFQSQQT